MREYGRCPAFGYECEYVAKVEAQAAEIEKFSGIAKLAILKAYDTDKFSTARIQAQAAEIERLRGIVSVWLDLAIGPDEMGDYHRQKWAIKASQEALEETLHVAETCKENGETFT